MADVGQIIAQLEGLKTGEAKSHTCHYAATLKLSVVYKVDPTMEQERSFESEP
jgi:hypothetical protein